jgi:hypothetical protein
MRGPKWDAASHAILAFANQGFPAPTRIGLSFMPFIFQTDAFGDQQGTNYKECDYRLYQDLVVPLAPATSQRGPLEAAIGGAITASVFGFGGSSPLYASLQGTYWAATKAQDANPDHQVAVVIMTDGDPTPCDEYGPEMTSPDALAALSASALHYDGVRTFALALEGGATGLLDKISSAGGGSVLTPASQTEDDFLAQMNVVTKSATECSFRLPAPPDGQALDPTTVSLDVTASTGEKTQLPAAAGPTSCHGEDGWYFDDAAQPTKAILCPATCAALKSASGSRIDVVLGCKAPLK